MGKGLTDDDAHYAPCQLAKSRIYNMLDAKGEDGLESCFVPP
jgi:hypothetical protein